MQTQASPLPPFWIRFLPWAGNLFFYAVIVLIVLISELPPLNSHVFFLRDQFLAGNKEVFRIQDPGIAFSSFTPFLPSQKEISFITDRPYAPRDQATEKLQIAQGWVAPHILNPDPVEKTALIFCSTGSIAEARIKVTGYRMVKSLGDGKGIAEKNP